jgi:outer membrane protein OmpA-like peptidoglycan-associated protein
MDRKNRTGLANLRTSARHAHPRRRLIALLLLAAVLAPAAPAVAQRDPAMSPREGEGVQKRDRRPERAPRRQRGEPNGLGASGRQPSRDRGETPRAGREDQRGMAPATRRDERPMGRSPERRPRENRETTREGRREPSPVRRQREIEGREQVRDGLSAQPRQGFQRENLRELQRQQQRREFQERQDRQDQRRDVREAPRNGVSERRRDPAAEPFDRRQAAPADTGRRSLRTIQRRRDVRREEGGREIIIEPGNRRIVRENNRVFIQHDEGERFRRLGGRNRFDRRDGRDGRQIITLERPGGVRVISVYDRNGRLIERSRRHNGRETVLIDNNRFWAGMAAGAAIGALVVTLGEPRVTIPRRRYIVDYGLATEDDLYDALSARPLEPFDRAYALEQIRYSHDLRNRLRRIDLTQINFASGSWDVAPDQIRKLDRLARAMHRLLERNPDEIFLIEGHTDAVGSEIDNLSLSDRRAESIAIILTDEYGIPPENLVTQGYGERFLAVETDADEPRNRRVAIRRITPLLAADRR